MKRRWFQIHLSTAVVLMVVAGAMIPVVKAILDSEYRITRPQWLLVTYVVIVALCVLMLVGVFCEYLIRGREARKP